MDYCNIEITVNVRLREIMDYRLIQNISLVQSFPLLSLKQKCVDSVNYQNGHSILANHTQQQNSQKESQRYEYSALSGVYMQIQTHKPSHIRQWIQTGYPNLMGYASLHAAQM